MLQSQSLIPEITSTDVFYMRQKREFLEIMGVETRNKYEILDQNQRSIAYVAEQGKGFLNGLSRYYLGHWRKFDMMVFNTAKLPIYQAHHPFRFYFTQLDIKRMDGTLIGSLQKRFSVLSKKFDILDSRGQVVLQISAPVWSFWTFPFYRREREVAVVKKKWSGLFSEAFLDKDNFMIEIKDKAMEKDERLLVLLSGIFIDLMYFEKKAR